MSSSVVNHMEKYEHWGYFVHLSGYGLGCAVQNLTRVGAKRSFKDGTVFIAEFADVQRLDDMSRV